MKTAEYGIYTNKQGKKILFYAVSGTFASDAWRSGDEKKYNECSGEKFTAITADDGKEYNLNRRNISRVSEEELDEMLESASEAFRLTIRLMGMKPSSFSKAISKTQFFMMNGVSFLLEEGYSPQEIEKYFIENYIDNEPDS